MEQGNLPRKWAESEFGFMLTHYLPICLDSPNRSGLWKNLKFGVTKFKSPALFLWECGPIFTPYIFWDFMATKIKHLKTEQFVICCPEIDVHPCILNSKKKHQKVTVSAPIHPGSTSKIAARTRANNAQLSSTWTWIRGLVWGGGDHECAIWERKHYYTNTLFTVMYCYILI